MANHYVYLVASLPMLLFGQKAPFSAEKFLAVSRDLIPDEDLLALEAILRNEEAIYEGVQPALRRWREFDTMLRNELVKVRASRKHIDPAKYLRKDGLVDPYISHAALNAYRNPSLIEAEKALDLERWRFLEELSFGHYFDLVILIIYMLKLKILERWQKISAENQQELLEKAIQAQ